MTTTRMPRKKVIDLVQNEKAWDAWRQTGIGASVGYDAMNMSKPLFDMFLDASVPASIEDMSAIARGNRLEPEARKKIEQKIMEPLFAVCMSRGIFNMSADAMDEDHKQGHEIKCPEVKGHEAHIRGELSHQKMHQCQQSMYVSGLKEWNFHSYCPEHDEQPLFSRVVKRDNAYIKRMVEKGGEFWDRVQKREWPNSELHVAELVSDVAAEQEGKVYSAPAIEGGLKIPSELEKRRDDLIKAMQTVKQVTTHEEAEFVTDLAKSAGNLIKALEAARTGVVKPHNDHVKEINNMFKEVTSVIKRGNDAIRAPLLKFHEEQERIAEEERQKEAKRLKDLQDAEDAKRAKEEEELGEKPDWLDQESTSNVVTLPPVSTKPQAVIGQNSRSGTSIVMDYDENNVDLSKVPVEFLTLNVPALRRHIKAGNHNIPGIKVIKKQRLNIR